jgi:hypothetical protein
MALGYTGEQLVTRIRNLGVIPNTGSTGSKAADILGHADEALRTYLLPELLSLREDYFVLRSRTTLVPGQAKYRIPPRASFNKLRDLWWVSGNDRVQLDPIPEEELDRYNGSGSSIPSGHIVEGNDVLLIPDRSPAFTGELEFVFFARPGDLVLSSAARQVQTVDPGTKTVTFASNVPTSWSNSLRFDVHSQHSGAELKVWDQPVISASGNTVVFTNPIDGSVYGTKAVEVGDWVVLADDAALPALPKEMHPLLVRASALHFAESAGDAQQAKVHAQLLEKALGKVLKVMETRVEGKPIRLGGRGRGMLKAGGRRAW